MIARVFHSALVGALQLPEAFRKIRKQVTAIRYLIQPAVNGGTVSATTLPAGHPKPQIITTMTNFT